MQATHTQGMSSEMDPKLLTNSLPGKGIQAESALTTQEKKNMMHTNINIGKDLDNTTTSNNKPTISQMTDIDTTGHLKNHIYYKPKNSTPRGMAGVGKQVIEGT